MDDFSRDIAEELKGYPPDYVFWILAIADTVCIPLHCRHWRETLNISPDSQWAYKVPKLSLQLPSMLKYSDFTQSRDLSPYSWRTMYQYAFQTPSTALAVSTTKEALLMLALLVLILRAIKSVIMPRFSALGRSVGRYTHGEAWLASNQIRIEKFGEYVFRLLFHTASSIYSWYMFKDSPWWEPGNTKTIFIGYPHQEMSVEMTWYYLVLSAYNVEALLSLLEMSFCVTWKNSLPRLSWSKSVRGDFQEMFVHHIVTNMLVIGSSHFRITYAGSMVFFVHDVSDIPVDLSKLANFVKYKYTTLACFLTMMAVWAYMRLYILPRRILKALLFEAHYLLYSGKLSPEIYLTYRKIFQGLMVILTILHFSWFLMFVQILFTFVRKRECHDLSEHKQGEDQVGSSSSSAAKHVSQARSTKKNTALTQDEKKDD